MRWTIYERERQSRAKEKQAISQALAKIEKRIWEKYEDIEEIMSMLMKMFDNNMQQIALIKAYMTHKGLETQDIYDFVEWMSMYCEDEGDIEIFKAMTIFVWIVLDSMDCELEEVEEDPS